MEMPWEGLMNWPECQCAELSPWKPSWQEWTMILQGDIPAALSPTAFTSSPSLHSHPFIKLVNLSLPAVSDSSPSFWSNRKIKLPFKKFAETQSSTELLQLKLRRGSPLWIERHNYSSCSFSENKKNIAEAVSCFDYFCDLSLTEGAIDTLVVCLCV